MPRRLSNAVVPVLFVITTAMLAGGAYLVGSIQGPSIESDLVLEIAGVPHDDHSIDRDDDRRIDIDHVIKVDGRQATAITLESAISEPTNDRQQQSRRSRNEFKMLQSFLTLEGKKALNEQFIEFLQPDFARRRPLRPDVSDIEDAMLVMQDSDAFVDAYIRWQFTSYKPSLPTIPLRQFIDMLRHYPKLMPNPRADYDAVETYRRTDGTLVNTESVQIQLEAMDKRLEERSRIALGLIHPAIGLRAWLYKQVGKEDERHILIKLNFLEHMVKAGWPIDQEITEMTTIIQNALERKALSRPQKLNVIGAFLPFRDLSRTYILNFGFDISNTAYVQWGTTEVSREQLSKWESALLKIEPPTPSIKK